LRVGFCFVLWATMPEIKLTRNAFPAALVESAVLACNSATVPRA
jgi:hypothetical protein